MNREAERKRLVELLEAMNKAPEITCPRFNKQDCKGCQFENGIACDIAGREANYLLDNGIFVPPIKAGQKVYIITEVSKTIRETEVIGIWQGEHEYLIITRIGTIHRNAVGETVFTSREEAEQSLKGSAGE